MKSCPECKGTGKIKASEEELKQRKEVCEKMGLSRLLYEWSQCSCLKNKNKNITTLQKTLKGYQGIADNCNIPSGKQKFCFDMYKLPLKDTVKEFLKNGYFYNQYKKKMTGFVFWSEKSGSGKTLLALSMAHSLAVEKKKKFIYENTTLLWTKLKDIYNKNRVDNYYHELPYLEKLSNAPILVMDDLGTEKPTEWMREKLYYIVETRNSDDDRMDIYTSNDSPEALAMKVGDKIVSRLMEFNEWIKFSDDVDWRLKNI